MNQLNSGTPTDENWPLEAAAKNLYKSILDAGIQFQMSEVSVSIRRELFDLSDKVSFLMAPHGGDLRSDKVILSEALTVFDAICAQVPYYERGGVRDLCAKNGIKGLKREMSSKITTLDTLQAQYTRCKATLQIALDRVKMFDSQSDTAAKESTKQLLLAQQQLNNIDRKIKSVTFFGADVLEP